MSIGNVHKKSGKDRACGSRDIPAHRQTDTQAQLITILRNRSHERRKNRIIEAANIKKF